MALILTRNGKIISGHHVLESGDSEAFCSLNLL